MTNQEKKEEKKEKKETTRVEEIAPLEEKAEKKEIVTSKSDVVADDAKKTTAAAKKKKGKFRRQVQRGCAYISSSYNNTLVSFTDLHGNKLAWSSAGMLGFKGAKKATTYAATQVVSDLHEKVQKYGLKELRVYVRGVGGGRDAALRAIAQKGYNIYLIKDTTPIPHNGCKSKKPRRV